MRLFYADLERPKRTAQLLKRLSSGATMPVIHDALARAVGYRHWHDLSASLVTPSTATPPAIEQITAIVLALAADLGLDDGDVQYALDRARLLATSAWGLDTHLALRSSIWRARCFGPQGRGQPGTLIKIPGHKQPAYLRAGPAGSNIFSDHGPGLCADSEIRVPRESLADFIPSYLWLPYGVWRLADGSEVAFSRSYMPLWRCDGQQVERLDPWFWIETIEDERHFSVGGEAWSRGRRATGRSTG